MGEVVEGAASVGLRTVVEVVAEAEVGEEVAVVEAVDGTLVVKRRRRRSWMPKWMLIS